MSCTACDQGSLAWSLGEVSNVPFTHMYSATAADGG